MGLQEGHRRREQMGLPFAGSILNDRICIALLLISCLGGASALPFRYGTLTWSLDYETTNGVIFKMEAAFQRDHPWGTLAENSGSPIEEWAPSSNDAFRHYYPVSGQVDECGTWVDSYNVGLSTATGKPSGCNNITVSPYSGYVLRLNSKELTQSLCTDPLDLVGNGCEPWNEVYGLYFGDGTGSAIDLEIYSVVDAEGGGLGDYVVGHGTLPKAYASPYDVANDAVWTAFFMGGDRLGYLENNYNGLFRLETTVDLRTANEPPQLMMLPILPVPYTQGYAEFDINAIDPDGDSLSFSEGTSEQYGGLFDYSNLKLSGATTANSSYSPSGPSGISVVGSKKVIWTLNGEQGFYNLVVTVSDGTVHSSLDMMLYLYYTPSFCDKQCRSPEPGFSTVVDMDGLYDGCTVCSNTTTGETDYFQCVPVPESTSCPGLPIDFSPPPPSPPPHPLSSPGEPSPPTPSFPSSSAAPASSGDPSYG
ncbi:hypothetical protein CYMTET_41473 [Cymbomonas tetramitiformis]|uniref:Uncharacterized protein n=1 Tax=Cymbomonas tetramitiformis TaxID=36881 RepID=A0AAE0C871_9CHLO|nr:hypothetical protein CYMTET_41473 [Cymbomonas tetramitiformis]